VPDLVRDHVRLREVARRAKVSISTVSRTINQTGKISQKTQAQVRRVMLETEGELEAR